MTATARSLHRTYTHWGAYDAEVAEGTVVAMRPDRRGPRSVADRRLPGRRPSPTPPASASRWCAAAGSRTDPSGPRGGRGARSVRGGLVAARARSRGPPSLIACAASSATRRSSPAPTAGAAPGRFHHAQSQVHRFMNAIGGYSYSVDTYSVAAAQVVLPHVVGSVRGLSNGHTAWPVIAEHSDLVVMFGGIPLKNAQVNSGGHRPSPRPANGCGAAATTASTFVQHRPPPRRTPTPCSRPSGWRPGPNTDVALMLGLAHTLVAEGRHDEAFLARYTVGFDTFRAYLTGASDGVPKDAAWAAEITAIAADDIRALARRMAGGAHDADDGMVAAARRPRRAALLDAGHAGRRCWGQIGLARRRFRDSATAPSRRSAAPIRRCRCRLSRKAATRCRATSRWRASPTCCSVPAPPSTTTERASPIPRLRIVYWCGGNPFHHHQDLNRLVAAWQRPDTVIVHEPWWNALARHADIVFPGDHRAGAGGYRRLFDRQRGVRHAPGRAAGGSGAQRLPDLRRPGRAPGRGGGLHGEPQRAGVAALPLQPVAPAAPPNATCRRRSSSGSGEDGAFVLPRLRGRPRAARRLPPRPRAPSPQHAKRPHRDRLRAHRRVWLRPTARAMRGVARAVRVAGRPAGRRVTGCT